MYKIGMIDDTETSLKDYMKRFERHDIELLIAPEGKMEEIKDWIVKEHLKCLLIDYQLSTEYDFKGTELAFYLNDALQGFPYLIITSFSEDSIEEKLVAENCIFGREVLESNENEFNDFCEKLKQITEVFDNTMKKYKEKYEGLLKKKKERGLTTSEEEDFVNFYRILKAYNEVDDIPAEMMRSSLSNQIDEVLKKLNAVLKDEEI